MLALFTALQLAPKAPAATLDQMVKGGEVAWLETSSDGRVKQVTAMSYVDASPAVVWAKLADWAGYASWMPTVTASTLVEHTDTVDTVDWTLGIAGPDIQFRARYQLDPERLTIDGQQVAGALPGSRWSWRLEPSGVGTIVSRVVMSNVVDTNWFLRQAENKWHTLEYGINLSSGVIELRGLKAALGG